VQPGLYRLAIVHDANDAFGSDLGFCLQPMKEASICWPTFLLPDRISPFANGLVTLVRHIETSYLFGLRFASDGPRLVDYIDLRVEVCGSAQPSFPDRWIACPFGEFSIPGGEFAEF
jgi:hypothetical protein